MKKRTRVRLIIEGWFAADIGIRKKQMLAIAEDAPFGCVGACPEGSYYFDPDTRNGHVVVRAEEIQPTGGPKAKRRRM